MSDDEITYISKPDLLKRIRQARDEFSEQWRDLNEDQMTAYPGPQSDWSVKDLVAHITWWETDALERIDIALEGGLVPQYEDYDAINEQVFNEYRAITLNDVLAEFVANLPVIESKVSQLSDDDLNDASRFKSNGRALRDIIIGNTFGHYADHDEDLKRYLRTLEEA